jgi:hypothetical protein
MRPAVMAVLLVSFQSSVVHAVDIMPMLGVGQPAGKWGDNYNLGVGVGVAVSGHLNPVFSLGGQVAYEGMNPKAPAPVIESSAYMIRLQVIPAFHLVRGRLDLAVGPTAGLFRFKGSASLDGPVHVSETVEGAEVGVLAEAMFHLTPSVALGPYLSYARLWAWEDCIASGSQRDCGNVSNDGQAFLDIGVGVRF